MPTIKNPLTVISGDDGGAAKRQVVLASVTTDLAGAYYSSEGYFTLSVQNLAPQVVAAGANKLVVVSPGNSMPAKLIPYSVGDDGNYTLDLNIPSVNLSSGSSTPYGGTWRRSNLVRLSDELVVLAFNQSDSVRFYPLTISGTSISSGTSLNVSSGVSGYNCQVVRLTASSLFCTYNQTWYILSYTNGALSITSTGTLSSGYRTPLLISSNRLVLVSSSRIELCEIESNNLTVVASAQTPTGFNQLSAGRCGDGVKIVRAFQGIIRHCDITIAGDTITVGEVVDDRSCVFTDNGYTASTDSAGAVSGRANEAMFNEQDGSVLFVINYFAARRNRTTRFGLQGSAILVGFSASGALSFCQPIGVNSSMYGVSFSGYCPTALGEDVALVSTNVGINTGGAEFGPPVPFVVPLSIIGLE